MASNISRGFGRLAFVTALVAAATFGVVALLVSIFERRQEARTPFVRLAQVTETTTDPEPWGINFPLQYESYQRSVDTERTEYGGSHALPPSRLEEDPWLKRLYSGYPFSVDYREARGHAFMLSDQEVTKRITDFQQSGACLHCHASIIPTYRRLGLEQQNQPVTLAALAQSFRPDAVMAGFEYSSKLSYEKLHAEMLRTPDSLPSVDDQAEMLQATLADADLGDPHLGTAHPVSCIDCHDPETMVVRVTRPGFIRGIAKLASSDAELRHLPSIAEWRNSDRETPYDPNVHATRQEMRSYVCGQCHVEYYCGKEMTLTFPWSNGLSAREMEQEWEQTLFDDGTPFFDYIHEETGTRLFKAQHPEFELWSQGIHARAGVSCSDCHMPYERQGATKVSSHWVRSPLLNINKACQTCHHVSEQELMQRAQTIQHRTTKLIDRAASAMTDMLDAILVAQKAGVSPDRMLSVRDLQRQAMWRLDFISSENSEGFHADQAAAQILAESIDYSRQAQAQCYRLLSEHKTQ